MTAPDLPAFPTHDDAWYQSRLALPRGKRRVVIDTDCANEIDDQFALAWALCLTESMVVEAVYAEPFSFAHRRDAYPHAPRDAAPFNPPDVGMARSHDEIIQVYRLLGLPWQGRVFAGSASYLSGPTIPVHSDAAHHLVATARACPPDEPLYVLALGCVTNIASALLLAPDIIDRIVVVWTSGFPSHAPHANHSFNLEQDLWASQLLLNSGVPLVYLPGYHVGAQLRLSLAEMERYVNGHSAIGNYLYQLFTHNPLWPLLGIDPKTANLKAHSWVIWDIICVAWLYKPDWVPSELVRTPRLSDDKRWLPDHSRPWMREAFGVSRDAIFGDFFDSIKTACR
jgi:purine nucleosidase